MAKNKSSDYKAYIENQHIKIITEDGFDFQEQLKNGYLHQKYMRYAIVAGAMIALIFSIFGVSSYFGSSFNKEQEHIFFVIVAIAGFATIGGLDYFNTKRSELERIKKQYNVAKSELQDDILELEKVLEEHGQDLQKIALQNSMDFTKNFKKRDATSYLEG